MYPFQTPQQDQLVLNDLLKRWEDLVYNQVMTRSAFFSEIIDRRAKVDSACGYPPMGTNISIEAYRQMYDRFSLSNRVVNVWPKESWQIHPEIYENDEKTKTEFEEALADINKMLRGERSYYNDEHSNALCEYLARADELSGIGTFGVILLGIGDGKLLEQPVDGAPPDGNPYTVPNIASGGYPQGSNLIPGAFGGQAGVDYRTVVGGLGLQETSKSIYGNPPPEIDPNRVRARDWIARDIQPGRPSGTPPQFQPPYARSPISPSQATMMDEYASVARDIYGGATQNPLSSTLGTDAQYRGIQFTPGFYPSGDPYGPINPYAMPGYPNSYRNGNGRSTPKSKLLFLRCFDEALVQVVQYEADLRNPRFQQPIMYLITFNDPRYPHTGVGLPLATLRVHWSRVVHLADKSRSAVSSEIFAMPRQQPVFNHLLDLRKLYGGSAEMYWQGALPGISFETQPQMGGDVQINVPQMQEMIRKYMEGLERYLQLSGMTAKTLSPTVVDPSNQINTALQAIAIQLNMPMRILMGSERGEMASTQDDANWNGRVRGRQVDYNSVHVVAPVLDRLILLGILPEPEDGYKQKWPDLDAQTDATKATIAVQRTQAISSFTGMQPESIMTPQRFYTDIMGYDQDKAEQIVEEAQLSQAMGQMSTTPTGSLDEQQNTESQTQQELGTPHPADMNQPEGSEEEAPEGETSPENKVTGNVWTDEARRKAAEARRAHAKHIDRLREPSVMSPNKEHQIVLDSSTGEKLHDAPGEWAQASIPVEHLTSGKQLTQLHTHSSNEGPSDADWGMMGWGAMNTMHMVGPNKVHTLQRLPGAVGKVTPRQLRERWNEILSEEEPKPKHPDQSIDDWSRGVIDRVNSRMAKEFAGKVHYSTSDDDLVTHARSSSPGVKGATPSAPKGAKSPTGGKGLKGTHSTDTSGGRWITLHPEEGEDELHHIFIGPAKGSGQGGPTVTKQGKLVGGGGKAGGGKAKVKRGSAPDVPIKVPKRMNTEHFRPSETKRHDILHDQQQKLVDKINSGEATADDHKKFAGIRKRLNELGNIAKKRANAVKARTGGKGDESERPDNRGAGGSDARGTGKPGGGMAGKAKGPSDTAAGSVGQDGTQPTGKKSATYIPAEPEQVNRRIDRYEQHFRSRGMNEVADWMGMLRNHINSVGPEEALKQLGGIGKNDEKTGDVRYEGEKAGWDSMSQFGKDYLNRFGISSVYDAGVSKDVPTVSSISKAFGGEGGLGNPQDYQAIDPVALKNKLDEAKALPGLEKSEDLSKLVGSSVTHLNSDVINKLDSTYGKDGWIVKPYQDYAFGGNGIFFPQRAKQIQQEAQNNLWSAGTHLSNYGFQHVRDKDGKVIGIQHEGGQQYLFGSDRYNNDIYGDVKHWGDVSAQAADNEQGAKLPEEMASGMMAQKAFPVIGISNEERAQGVTFKTGQEGRVHIVTRNGKAELVPHSTWLKNEALPVVFESDDTKAMAQSAVDAINSLPESERQGQIYAPDIVRTADGFRVVEANPSNYSGPSGYLGDNPMIIDSYVSHLTDREPAHVQFIKKLLSKKG